MKDDEAEGCQLWLSLLSLLRIGCKEGELLKTRSPRAPKHIKPLGEQLEH